MVAWVVCPGEETVAAYVAGQLARAERDLVDSHLDTCSACQELVAVLAKLQPPRDEEPQTSLGVASLAPSGRDSAGWVPGGQLGRYVLLARIGAGGMGVVYSAYDPELDRRIALKVLRRTRAGTQLRAEARAIAKLSHPHVIAVHDVGEADGEVFVAMEYVDGVTVRDWLRAPRQPAAILDVFVQAGRGLAAAHRAGLVHRDVKPSNIIVGSDGRARMLDFGLARPATDDERAIVGTPGYMAPEQRCGDRVDARADQYAFCVALWEALAGTRPEGEALPPLSGVPDRIGRALRRGLAADPRARFPTLDELLGELAPPPARTARWLVALAIAAVAITAGVVLAGARDSTPSCARSGDPVLAAWSVPQRGALHAAFVATGVPYAARGAEVTTRDLDAWSRRWRDHAEATCRATVIDRSQPPELHALRQGCLGQLVERLNAIVGEALAADAQTVARGTALVSALPDPARCDDVTALAALPPLPPAERDRAAIATLRAEIAEHEAALLAGRALEVRDSILALRARADAIAYGPLRARTELLIGRLELSSADYAAGIAALHAAARAATAARDLEALAEIWVELGQALGNDPRTLDEAELFDGYAAALIEQLPDRDRHELELAFARCNRNVTAATAAEVAAHCEQAIARGERASPPARAVVNAARARLGHFQRLQGQDAKALATLREALAEAVAFHGAQHPEVAIARYALGIALIAQEQFEAGIVELRESLAIRRLAFPVGSIQVAESLQGLGDALGSAGQHAEAIALLTDAVRMLEAIQQGESAHAASSHMMLGMSLEEVGRAADALGHYLRAADIADRTLQHREALAAMGLRLAAGVEAGRGRVASGIPHLERAIRLLERGKAPPAELGRTQLGLAQLLFALGPAERERARAMAEAARGSFVTAGAPAQVADVDRLLRAHR